MIEIKITDDYDFVKSVFTHPDVWDGITDDNGLTPETIDVTAIGGTFVVPLLDGVPMGCLRLEAHNACMVELHTAILPEYRGTYIKPIFDALIQWLWNKTPCKKLITFVPVFNRAAMRAALNVGFSKEGKLSASFLKNGVLYDQVILGVSKCQQQQ